MNPTRMSLPALPAPAVKLLSLLPSYPGSLLFAAGLNLTLRDKLPADVQRALATKKLRIQVTDASLAFDFRWQGNGFVACRSEAAADLTIAASANDFLLLARRQEDPDTLFFSRRLSMEGDTELGLLMKNTLDAMELPLIDTGRLASLRIPAWLKPARR